MQEKVVEAVYSDLRSQRWSLLKCGMRSGKGVMALQVAVKGQFDHVAYFVLNQSQTRDLMSSFEDAATKFPTPR